MPIRLLLLEQGLDGLSDCGLDRLWLGHKWGNLWRRLWRLCPRKEGDGGCHGDNSQASVDCGLDMPGADGGVSQGLPGCGLRNNRSRAGFLRQQSGGEGASAQHDAGRAETSTHLVGGAGDAFAGGFFAAAEGVADFALGLPSKK